MAGIIGKFTDRATAFLALLGAVGVVAMLVHICAYVISRHVLAAPIPATVEIVSRYYMVLIAFLPISWAERRGDMISVEVVAQLFTGWLRRADMVFVALVTTGAYGVLTYTTWIIAMREFATKSYVISLSTAIPVWPSYFILPISFALAAFVSLLKLLLIVSGNDPVSDAGLPKEEFRE